MDFISKVYKLFKMFFRIFFLSSVPCLSREKMVQRANLGPKFFLTKQGVQRVLAAHKKQKLLAFNVFDMIYLPAWIHW